MDTLTIERATAPSAGIIGLLQAHFELMRATSPAESCHVLEPQALFAGDTVVMFAREAGKVLGVGAYKPLDATHGELKSMHTVQAARGRGVARAILCSLMDHAAAAGITRLSLETGSADAFAPARNLYAVHGFEFCPPFCSYGVDPLSVYMTRNVLLAG